MEIHFTPTPKTSAMKKIEELARGYVDSILMVSKNKEQIEKMRDIIETVYCQSAKKTLEILLEEVPKHTLSYKGEEFIYLEVLNSLIKNKI